MRPVAIGLMALVLCLTSAWGQPPTPAPRLPAAPGQAPGTVSQSLTLEAAEALLLQQNLAIVAARYAVDLARALRLTAAVRPNPTLTLGGKQFNLNSAGRTLTTTATTASQRTYTWRLDQLIERGRKRQLRTEAADFQLQAAEAQVLDTIRTQRLQLRQTFYTAVLARENVRVAVENLDLTTATERLIQVRVHAGDAPAWDLIKFQANKVAFQQDPVKAQLAYQQAVSDLLALLNVPAGGLGRPVPAGGVRQLPAPLMGAPLAVIGDLAVEPRPLTVSREALREVALAQRPDVVVAQRAVEAARRTLDLAYAQRHGISTSPASISASAAIIRWG